MESLLQAPANYVKKEKVSYIKSKLQLLNGELFLTEDRLILISNKTTLTSGLGFLGVFLKNKVESKKYGFNIKLENITQIEQGKHGLQKNVLEITDLTSKAYRIVVKNFNEWNQLLVKEITKE